MFLGREAELRRVEDVLDAAAGGESAALVVSGEAGIGKSALLDRVMTDAAARPGTTVLRTQGIESESAIPFAGLADLLRPVQHLLPALPERQATALGGALALGPPTGPDRFAVAAATLSLLAAATGEGPLLCVVDDAHWLDPSSAEALVFAARRMRAEGAVVLCAVRDDTPGAERFAPLPQLRLQGLDPASAATLLAGGAGGPLPARVVARLVADTGGNPLALRELPAHLSQDRLGGHTPIHEPLPVGSLLRDGFLRQVRQLPPATRSALLVAAASDLDTTDAVDRALTAAGQVLTDLEPAEAADLVALDGGHVAFRHPLIRSAIYHAAAPAERRAAHRALAAAFEHAAVPQADERRAWHLAAATTTSDEGVAAELERVGHTAARHHSHAVAARAFERAAGLTPDRGTRARRLMAAAGAAVPAGAATEAMRLLGEAGRWSDDPAVAAVAECERLRLGAWGPDGAGNRARLFAFAEQRERTQPAVAVRAYLAAAQASLSGYDVAAITSAAGRAARLAGQDDEVRLFCDVLTALAAAQGGRGDDAAALLAQRHEQLLTHDVFDVEQLVTAAGVAYLACERTAEARQLLERVVTAGRHAGAAGMLAVQLPWLAALEWQAGEWATALALAHEAVLLASETGWLTQLPNSLSTLARVEAGFGAPSCREHASRAVAAAGAGGQAATAVHALAAVGLLELGLGHDEAAAERLAEADEAAGPEPAPLLRLQVLPDLVEARIRSGAPERARAALAVLDDLAQRSRRTSALAAAARCHGLLDHTTTAFERALAWHAAGTPPFEVARTRAAFGSRLRREHDRAGAREHLGAALATFERLGAAPWAAMARAELQGSGGSPPAARDRIELALTPQELQVSIAVRGGMTNAAVAAALFLSVKTVEYHLSNIYRKVGVRSRTQLIRVLDRDRTPLAV